MATLNKWQNEIIIWQCKIKYDPIVNIVNVNTINKFSGTPSYQLHENLVFFFQAGFFLEQDITEKEEQFRKRLTY